MVAEADEAAAIEKCGPGRRVDARHVRVAGRFGRGEPRRRVLAYLRGLPGPVGRKNGSSVVKLLAGSGCWWVVPGRR